MKKIYIKCQNGISFAAAKRDIFFNISDEFDFIESDQPDFILFGPYGNEVPPRGDYSRIGYFCENIYPDLSICEWAFGIPLESEINDPKYRRIQWHGLHPEVLKKSLTDNDIDQILNEKNKFCNFFYSNPVPYREAFFKQLSKYKKIDAPGKSMHNMPAIDHLYQGNQWERKRKFLTEYKFTIAFENYVSPGYQTEKLYDAMLVNSLPIYCGDTGIDAIFNKKSFLNAAGYIEMQPTRFLKALERLSFQNFKDYNPTSHNNFTDKVFRKFKYIGRTAKMKIQLNHLDFTPLIDRIIEIDNNEELYIKYLKEPWFNNNQLPEATLLKQRWMEIFNGNT